jgi:cytochrome c oxidase subunit 2
MDKIELRVMKLTAGMLAIFLLALLYASYARNMGMPACVPYSGVFSKPHLQQIDSNTYEAFFVAKMWSFEPSDVYVPAGSDVDIYLTSSDVVHGFNISEKAVNLMAVPGAINKKTVHFEKAGIYKIVCHEYCGIGHHSMEGEIIVYDKTK